MKTMLAAIAEQPGVLAVREVPVPVIDETECLVEILACGICNSTDRKLLDGHFRYRGPEVYPGILGHEAVGRVIECGSAVTSFCVGDLVLRPGASYPSTPEGPSFSRPSSLFGGLAQFGKVKDPVLGGSPMHQIVPPGIDPTDATMLVTLKETLSWLQRWPVQPGQSVAVLGTGPVGLCFAFFAKLLGCHPVIVVGRRDEPLQRALQFGVDGVVNTSTDDPAQVVGDLTGGKGADRVIEAIGSDEALQLGLSLLSPQGRLGVYGIASTREPGDMERRTLDLGLARNEWAVEFLGPQEWAPHEQMLWFVQQGIVRLGDWYTHTVPLAGAQRGFDLLESKEASKVVVEMPPA